MDFALSLESSLPLVRVRQAQNPSCRCSFREEGVPRRVSQGWDALMVGRFLAANYNLNNADLVIQNLTRGGLVVSYTMAADPTTSNAISALFNYDVDSDDPFDISTTKRPKESSTRDDKPTLSPRPTKRTADDKEKDPLDLDLGLDAEVKIAKKRKPNPKLDEARLLSAPGLPKLRALAQSGQLKKRLGLRGKGHEFSDVAKLLNYYQLWLDDLYPKARFRDGLVMVEKAGHGKSMARIRREWIDEGKPSYVRDRLLRDEDRRERETAANGPEDGKAAQVAAGENTRQAPRESIFGNGLQKGNDTFLPSQRNEPVTDDQEGPEEGELEALLAMQDAAPAEPRQAEFDSEDEDGLDALLAHQSSRTKNDARGVVEKRFNRLEHSDRDDDDDLDALLADQESRREVNAEPRLSGVSPDITHVEDHTPQRPAESLDSESSKASFSSSPVPNTNELDELDALLAE